MADLTYALQNVVQHGTGSYAASQIDRPLAGKTGTSQDAKSAWFAGYTPQLATAVGLYREGKDKDGKASPALAQRPRRQPLGAGCLVPAAHLDGVHEGRHRGHEGRGLPGAGVRRQEQRADATDGHGHRDPDGHRHADRHADVHPDRHQADDARRPPCRRRPADPADAAHGTPDALARAQPVAGRWRSSGNAVSAKDHSTG